MPKATLHHVLADNASVFNDVPYTVDGFMFSTDEIIAWGTIGLVLVGIFTLIANWRTIVAAERAANAALAQVRTAYPNVDVFVDPIALGTQVAVARVRWLAGVLPARSVRILVHGPSYLHGVEIPILGPADAGRIVTLTAAPANVPQPEGVAVPSAPGKVWRSISWIDPDDKARMFSGEIDSG